MEPIIYYKEYTKHELDFFSEHLKHQEIHSFDEAINKLSFLFFTETEFFNYSIINKDFPALVVKVSILYSEYLSREHRKINSVFFEVFSQKLKDMNIEQIENTSALEDHFTSFLEDVGNNLVDVIFESPLHEKYGLNLESLKTFSFKYSSSFVHFMKTYIDTSKFPINPHLKKVLIDDPEEKFREVQQLIFSWKTKPKIAFQEFLELRKALTAKINEVHTSIQKYDSKQVVFEKLEFTIRTLNHLRPIIQKLILEDQEIYALKKETIDTLSNYYEKSNLDSFNTLLLIELMVHYTSTNSTAKGFLWTLDGKHYLMGVNHIITDIQSLVEYAQKGKTVYFESLTPLRGRKPIAERRLFNYLNESAQVFALDKNDQELMEKYYELKDQFYLPPEIALLYNTVMEVASADQDSKLFHQLFDISSSSFENELLFRRNEAWINDTSLVNSLKTSQESVVIIVGAAHLFGEKGLIRRLEKEGLFFTQIPLN
ncbi:MAG: hypothetical protein Tsb0021_18380 [Chlamydiales bacterium]